EMGNEHNSETIFTVENSKDLILAGRIGTNSNSGGNTLHAYFLSKYDDLPGMQRDVVNGRPWATFKPTNWALNIYDRELDARYSKLWKRVFYCNRPGTYKIRGKDVVLALGDTAVYFPDHEWTADQLDAAP